MAVAVKICGLREQQHVAAACAAGARYLGFVFFDKSPRHVSVEQASQLMADVPAGLAKVALTVNASDEMLDQIVSETAVDMLQLHGRESVERVAEIKARFGLPVMKAIGVAEANDLAQIDVYARVADQLLIDAKAPKGAKLPGGNGLAFDWGLLQRKYWACPWMLAGGLDASNLHEALKVTGANQVDLSSGVETAPGIKDERLMAQFCAAARGD